MTATTTPTTARPAVPKPLPSDSGRSGEFYGWCRKGELRFLRCNDCRSWQHPPRLRCTACQSESLSWEASTGRATIQTFTIVRRPLHPAFADVPFGIAIAETDEGVRLLAQVPESDLDGLRIGAPATVRFHRATDDIAIPYFSLTGQPDGGACP